MKFCDKLSKLRKNNNLSQEQLADRLGVSRQAVSKWESGISHPDMEKILQMCKILDCTLEELMDDHVIGGKAIAPSEKKNHNYLSYFLDFITQVVNMFSTMKLEQKVKCLVELFLEGFVLYWVEYFIFHVLYSMTTLVLDIFPYGIQYHALGLFSGLYEILLLILGIVILFHIFKVRYLDYFVTIEDNFAREKTIEKPVENGVFSEKDKEVVIIRDPKHSSFHLLSLLHKIFLWVGRVFIVAILFPILALFVLFITVLVVFLCHIFYGKIFLFLSLIALGFVGITYLGVHVLFQILFHRKTSYTVSFLVLIGSVVLISVASGLTIVSLTEFHSVTSYDDIPRHVDTKYFEVGEDMRVYANGPVKYVIDNSLANAKMVISYVDWIRPSIYMENSPYGNYIEIYDGNVDWIRMYHYLLSDWKEKRLRRYDDPATMMDVEIYLSEENYQKIVLSEQSYDRKAL